MRAPSNAERIISSFSAKGAIWGAIVRYSIFLFADVVSALN